MATCPSCLRSVPDEALSCPACGAAVIASATPTKRQPAIEPAYPASPAIADVQVKRLTSPGVRSEGRFIAGAMLAGRYRIVSLLGRGGMGEVYKAEDLKLHQTVALKFLPETIAFDAAALARFHNEVRIARQVAHPNVCHVYDIGEVEGLYFLSMEFIDGEDLGALLRKVGRLPGDKAVSAAGNSDESNQFNEFIPASYDLPNTITVGAVDQAGDEAAFTSFGKVDLYANGYAVESVLPGREKHRWSGTSMAAPQVVNLAPSCWRPIRGCAWQRSRGSSLRARTQRTFQVAERSDC